MIITFCGHSSFVPTPEYEHKLLSLLHELVVDGNTEFFLGEYGAFDTFAYECCKKIKATHPNVKLIFVTPYISPEYQKNYLNHQEMRYDHIIYPPLENVPPKFAISRRNKWMVQKADLVIAYIRHDWGGAYKTYQFARHLGKKICDL